MPPHHQNANADNGGGTWTKGEVQPRKCNDVIFAVLFIAHLGVMAGVAVVFGSKMYGEVAEQAMNGRERELMDEGAEDEGGYDGLVEDNERSVGVKGRFLTWMVKSTHRIIVATSSSASSGDYSHRDLEEDNGGTTDIADMMILLAISALIALVISTAALSVMIRHAQFLIKFALLFNIAATAVVSLSCDIISVYMIHVMCFCWFVFTTCAHYDQIIQLL